MPRRPCHIGRAPHLILNGSSAEDDSRLSPDDRRSRRYILQDDRIRANNSIISYGDGSSYDSTCINAHAITYSWHAACMIFICKPPQPDSHILMNNTPVTKHRVLPYNRP